jgi:hypothetical protein
MEAIAAQLPAEKSKRQIVKNKKYVTQSKETKKVPHGFQSYRNGILCCCR